MLGAQAVWAPAATFNNGRGIGLVAGGEVEYFHLPLGNHHCPLAEGVEAESLHRGDSADDWLAAETEADRIRRFPEFLPFASRETSFPAITVTEAQALLAA